MSEEEKTALESPTLEQKILTAIDGHSVDEVEEAVLLVLHRTIGVFLFGRLLLGSKYR